MSRYMMHQEKEKKKKTEEARQVACGPLKSKSKDIIQPN